MKLEPHIELDGDLTYAIRAKHGAKWLGVGPPDKGRIQPFSNAKPVLLPVPEGKTYGPIHSIPIRA